MRSCTTPGSSAGPDVRRPARRRAGGLAASGDHRDQARQHAPGEDPVVRPRRARRGPGVPLRSAVISGPAGGGSRGCPADQAPPLLAAASGDLTSPRTPRSFRIVRAERPAHPVRRAQPDRAAEPRITPLSRFPFPSMTKGRHRQAAKKEGTMNHQAPVRRIIRLLAACALAIGWLAAATPAAMASPAANHHAPATFALRTYPRTPRPSTSTCTRSATPTPWSSCITSATDSLGLRDVPVGDYTVAMRGAGSRRARRRYCPPPSGSRPAMPTPWPAWARRRGCGCR